MENKIRFSQYVYDQIMAGNFDTACILTKHTCGTVCTSEFTLYSDYSWFGFKKNVTLNRIVKNVTEDGNLYDYAFHNIPLKEEEQTLLWSVWPKVQEIVYERRGKKIQEKLALTERLSWWP